MTFLLDQCLLYTFIITTISFFLVRQNIIFHFLMVHSSAWFIFLLWWLWIINKNQIFCGAATEDMNSIYWIVTLINSNSNTNIAVHSIWILKKLSFANNYNRNLWVFLHNDSKNLFFICIVYFHGGWMVLLETSLCRFSGLSSFMLKISEFSP